MPRKRAAEDSNTSSSKSQKSTATQSPNRSTKPRSKRWSAVSVSANLEKSYEEHRDYNAYRCLCQGRVDGKFDNDDDEDDDDDDDDDEDGDDEDEDESEGEENDVARSRKAKCDGGKTCICQKPAAEHPDHPLTITVAGWEKFVHQMIHTNLRIPDNFGMYIFNDFAGYGVLEILQNLVLDFVEAKDNWKEQWAVCEAIPFYWMSEAPMPFSMLDRDTVQGTYSLLGRMFVTMLATLESKDLLKPDSEIKNLGVIMGLWIELTDELRQYNCLEPEIDDTFDGAKLDSYVLEYSKKYQIELQGPSKLSKLVRAIEADYADAAEDGVETPIPVLPARSADPWGWSAEYKAYAKDLGTITFVKKKGMGGDSFDITSWSSAERKKQAFDKQDPFGKKEIEDIKAGMILQLG